MLNRILILTLMGFSSFGVTTTQSTINTTKKLCLFIKNDIPRKTVNTIELYNSLDTNGFSQPNFDCFSYALDGYTLLVKRKLIINPILTIIDFNKPSTEKRLWVIDMRDNKILFHTLVAHGKNSGDLFATDFSNDNESLKSSLGFYSTSESYFGKHGLSLRLDGLEKNKNDNARKRAIVVHGADYVSNAFIKSHNRLGRSFGCPTLPLELTEKIINTIKNKSCLFIYHKLNRDILVG